MTSKKCYCPDAKLRYGESALCEYCAYEKGIREERERCAKIAGEKRKFSPMPNPSDLDLGWKRCAAKIEEDIRRS